MIRRVMSGNPNYGMENTYKPSTGSTSSVLGKISFDPSKMITFVAVSVRREEDALY